MIDRLLRNAVSGGLPSLLFFPPARGAARCFEALVQRIASRVAPSLFAARSARIDDLALRRCGRGYTKVLTVPSYLHATLVRTAAQFDTPLPILAPFSARSDS